MEETSVRSGGGAPPTTGPALGGQLCCPPFDLGAKPKLDAPIAELAHRTRHIVVPVLVDADGVPVGKTEELGNAVCVEEIVDVHLSAHEIRLLQYSDLSEP